MSMTVVDFAFCKILTLKRVLYLVSHYNVLANLAKCLVNVSQS